MELNEPNSDFWAFARRLKGKKTLNKPIYDDNRIELTNHDKANILAQHFYKQFMPHDNPRDLEFIYEVRHYVQDWLAAPTARNLIDRINKEEVSDITKHLRVKKAPGYDEISDLAIKHN
ncbi:hypothetical protein X975_13367, partial [Stegodyphus mimosarum]